MENNAYPIEIAQLNPTDMDMNTDSPVKYELILPFSVTTDSMVLPHEETANLSKFMQPANKLAKCSINLYDSLSIDSSNGVITLNSSLDREVCANYLFSIRATDLMEPRIHSLINLRIHVNDLNDNGPRFQQDTYTFFIAENTIANTTNAIRVNDPDLSSDLEYTIESDANEDMSEFFAVIKDEARSKLVKLVIKKPLDYETRNKYEFKLTVSEKDSSVS